MSTSVSAGLWGFAGVNYPVHDFVAGGEIDAGGFSPYGALAASASLRARLGVVVRDGVLIYATGGGALGQFAASPRGPGALDASWNAGGGVETMISAGLPWRVSWRIEFLHIGPAGGRAANVVRTGFAIPF